MAKVTIPERFFLEEALKEYHNCREKMVAELIQNSRDAGASQIKLNFTDSGYSIEDDGVGMDKQTLLNGLLTLGGSVKSADSTGAFGAAKKLLLFSHKSYTIHTRNLLATGKVLDYDLREDAECFYGTKISCEYFDGFSYKEQMVDLAKHVLAKCDFSNSCSVFINGEEFIDWMSWPQASVLETDWATIKTIDGNGLMYIRKNGIFSFSRWTSSNKKQVIIELKPPSREVFTQNRDGLRPPYSSKLDAVAAELSQNETTFGHVGIREYIYLGKNKFLEYVNKIKELSSESSIAVSNLGSISYYVTKEQKQQVIDALSAFNSSIDQKQLAEVNQEICDEIQNDFVVDLADSHYTTPPEQFSPKTMKKRYKFLAQLWKETILEILKVYNYNLDFQIGFTLDKNCQALYSKKSGVVRLLLNPTLFKFVEDTEKRFWNIFVTALEEVCHAIAHNESYCSNHGEDYNHHKNKMLEKILPEISWRTVWKNAQKSTL
jgi:hypothetical protein